MNAPLDALNEKSGSAPRPSADRPTLAPIFVDHTHLGRHVTGLERITLELFSADSLAPLRLTPVASSGTAGLIAAQNATLPLKLLRNRRALMLCPGFPPALPLQAFGARVVPYIHDLFLLNRAKDLNPRARLYMAPAFRRAVKTLPLFMVNSQYTADELRKYCRPDAQIQLYRPAVRNVFGLSDESREGDSRANGPLRLIALGTIEPRKNLSAAADILAALQANGHPDATLDIVGRFGWGEEIERLKAARGVTLHGYQPIEQIRALMARADLFLNTSHDEGLGLPLLEAQYAGLPVIAPDQKVFREVLGDSGLFINPADPKAAAAQIRSLLAQADWRPGARAKAAANLARWNKQVETDKTQLIERLGAMTQMKMKTKP